MFIYKFDIPEFSQQIEVRHLLRDNFYPTCFNLCGKDFLYKTELELDWPIMQKIKKKTGHMPVLL